MADPTGDSAGAALKLDFDRRLAEVAVPRQMFTDILSLIARLRAPPVPA
jgi:hypothetical protein